MKKSVLSLEEKTSHHWSFFTFKLLKNILWLTELGGANIKHLSLLFEQSGIKVVLFYFSEHQELSKEINEISDSRIREDMERELGGLVSRMEAKSLQISKIRRHQERASWNMCLLDILVTHFLVMFCLIVCELDTRVPFY